MGIISGIVVFVIIWWLVLLLVLPWGIRVPDETQPGFATSAPEKPRLWLKAAVTTVITVILWFAADYIITADLISFRPSRR